MPEAIVIGLDSQDTQRPPKLVGFLLAAGDGLLCSNQTRLLALRAAQSVFFAKPAAKNADTTAFLPPQNDGGRGFKSI